MIKIFLLSIFCALSCCAPNEGGKNIFVPPISTPISNNAPPSTQDYNLQEITSPLFLPPAVMHHNNAPTAPKLVAATPLEGNMSSLFLPPAVISPESALVNNGVLN